MSEDRAEQEVVRILRQLAEAMSRTGPMDIELDNGEKVRVMLAEPHGDVSKYGKWLETNVERFGGQILELPHTEWQKLVA